MATTAPELFIIESLDLDDEEKKRPEGKKIADMLALSGQDGKKCQYFYIRTDVELKAILREFKKSDYRYLHLSCHGLVTDDEKPVGLALTFKQIRFGEAAEMLCPYIDGRRVFISACRAAKLSFARALLESTKCRSVMASSDNIDFGDGALFWASFYHLMFKHDHQKMSNQRLMETGSVTANLFGMNMKLYTKNADGRAVEHCLKVGRRRR